MIQGAIHNPSNHQHFMQLDRLVQRVSVHFDGVLIAESSRAIRLLEAARRLYQPQYYLPRDSVLTILSQTEKSTYCPLKGTASYFDIVDVDGAVVSSEIGWSYQNPLEFSSDIAGYIAFDPKRVSITVYEALEA